MFWRLLLAIMLAVPIGFFSVAYTVRGAELYSDPLWLIALDGGYLIGLALTIIGTALRRPRMVIGGGLVIILTSPLLGILIYVAVGVLIGIGYVIFGFRFRDALESAANG